MEPRVPPIPDPSEQLARAAVVYANVLNAGKFNIEASWDAFEELKKAAVSYAFSAKASL